MPLEGYSERGENTIITRVDGLIASLYNTTDLFYFIFKRG